MKQEREQEAANTFEVIAREWYAQKLPEWSKTNAVWLSNVVQSMLFASRA